MVLVWEKQDVLYVSIVHSIIPATQISSSKFGTCSKRYAACDELLQGLLWADMQAAACSKEFCCV